MTGWFNANPAPRRAFPTAAILLPWLLAAEVAALTSQNYLTPQSGTVLFSLLVILAELAIGAIIAAAPERLAKFLFAMVLLVCFDVITQSLQQVNGYLNNAGLGSLSRHMVDAAVFAAALGGLFLMSHTALRRFASVAGALLLASVILFPHADSSLGWTEKPKPGPLGRVVVHLMLDEHTGVAGFENHVPGGAQAAAALRKFYIGNGFLLFPNAYSEYNYTDFSVPAFMGLDDPDPTKISTQQLVARWREPFAWFTQLHRAGYDLHVFSVGESWNMCVKDLRPVASACVIAGDGELVSDKAFLLATPVARTMAEDFSILVDRTPLLGVVADRLGLTIEIRGQGPAHGLMVMDRIAEEIGTSSGDRAWFAHLWFPHHPMVVNADCSARTPPANDNMPAVWSAYEGQVACTRKGIVKILAALRARGALGRAVIIIQGDHGLRPTSPGYDIKKWQIITHSALFAVRLPGQAAGEADCSYAIQALLPAVAHGGKPRPGDGVVTDVTDPDFWFRTEGSFYPKLKPLSLSVTVRSCTPALVFPGVVHIAKYPAMDRLR